MEIQISAPAGEGKTHLAKAIVREQAEHVVGDTLVAAELSYGDYRNLGDMYEMLYGHNVIIFDEITNVSVFEACKAVASRILKNGKALIIYNTQF